MAAAVEEPKLKRLSVFGKAIEMREDRAFRLLYGTAASLVAFNCFTIPFLLPKLRSCIGAPYVPTRRKLVESLFDDLLGRYRPQFARRQTAEDILRQSLNLGTGTHSHSPGGVQGVFVAQQGVSPSDSVSSRNSEEQRGMSTEERGEKRRLPTARSTATGPSTEAHARSRATTPPRLLDFGSGDGRIVLAAAKRGFSATGYEINLWLHLWARFRAWLLLTEEEKQRVELRWGNIWRESEDFYHKFDVVTIYGRPGDNVMARFAALLQKSLHGREALVVSNVFAVPGWDRKLAREMDNLKLYDMKL